MTTVGVADAGEGSLSFDLGRGGMTTVGVADAGDGSLSFDLGRGGMTTVFNTVPDETFVADPAAAAAPAEASRPWMGAGFSPTPVTDLARGVAAVVAP